MTFQKMEKPFKGTLNFYRFLLFSSFIPYFGIIPFAPTNILGFNWSGWAWVYMLLICIIYIFKIKHNKFPLFIWIPFVGYTLIWAVIARNVVSFQFFFQPIIPLFVGIIASGLYYNKVTLKILTKYVTLLLLFLIFIVFIYTPIKNGYIDAFKVPSSAALVMSIVMFSAFYLSIYFVFKKNWILLLYLFLIFIPFYLVTRMAIFLSIVVFPFHFLNNNFAKKIFSGAIGILAGVFIFYSKPVQEKMFYQGEGTVQEVSWDNPDFNTSGRNTYKLLVEDGLKKNQIIGNGPRADLELYTYFGLNESILHDDYLLIRYSYGWLGIILYFTPLLLIFINLLRKMKKNESSREYKVIWGTALTLFIPYLGFMYTDNIFLYGPWYGYFFFALIGISFNLSSSTQVARKIPEFKPNMIVLKFSKSGDEHI
jgi:hypothetical protein